MVRGPSGMLPFGTCRSAGPALVSYNHERCCYQWTAAGRAGHQLLARFLHTQHALTSLAPLSSRRMPFSISCWVLSSCSGAVACGPWTCLHSAHLLNMTWGSCSACYHDTGAQAAASKHGTDQSGDQKDHAQEGASAGALRQQLLHHSSLEATCAGFLSACWSELEQAVWQQISQISECNLLRFVRRVGCDTLALGNAACAVATIKAAHGSSSNGIG